MHAITRLIISHWLDPFVPFSEDFKKSIFKKLKSSSQQNLVQENGLLEPPSKKKRKIDSENFEVLFLSETQAGKQTENHLPITSEDCIENVSFKAEYFLSVGSLNKVESVFQMVGVSILAHVVFEPINHREDAPTLPVG